ncbi:MAG: VWA domain-containing protein [Candidatus Thiodiazotropha sp. (ex Lucinoma borealis)]|nr:VWA domain-containing protein [Candidatus Thiodiazotropha sp. (ex Lucinoma borealis)]
MTGARVIMRVAVLVLCSLIAGQSIAVDRVFLVDTSGSMKGKGLFERIRTTLKDRYVQQAEPGEHIIVLGFDEDVSIIADRQIQTQADRDNVLDRLDELEANGQWTWLSRAMETAVAQAGRLRASNPQGELNVYLLTDGVNDPPPSAQEKPASLADILSGYGNVWNEQGANIYILVYDKDDKTLEEDGLQRWGAESRDRMEEKPLPPEILFSYTGFVLEGAGGHASMLQTQGSLRVEDIGDGATGTVISLGIERESGAHQGEIMLNPASIAVQRAGQVERVDVELVGNPSTGTHVANILLEAKGAFVVPQRIPITVEIQKDGENPGGTEVADDTVEPEKPALLGWPAIPVFVALLLTLYFLFLLLRQNEFWVRRTDGSEQWHIQVSGLRKVSLKRLGAQEYAIGLGVAPRDLLSAFLFRQGKRVARVRFDKEVELANVQGGTIAVIVSARKGGKMAHGGQRSAGGHAGTVGAIDQDPDIVKKNKRKRHMD